jgi:hypothetical protein
MRKIRVKYSSSSSGVDLKISGAQLKHEVDVAFNIVDVNKLPIEYFLISLSNVC